VITNRASTEIKREGGVRIAVSYAGPPAPDATIVICHGICEHRGRYSWFVDRCSEQNLACISFDLRGHGDSTGPRGHIDSFEEYLEDIHAVNEFRQSMLEQFGGRRRCFLLGHSLGGVIVTRYVQTYSVDPEFSGIILSSPGFLTAVNIPTYKRMIAAGLTKMAPRLSLATGIHSSALSSDEVEQRAYDTDPKIFSKVSLKWFAEYENAGKVAMECATAIKLPIIAFYGTADRVISIEAVETFIEGVGSSDKEVRGWSNLRHELLHEGIETRKSVVSEVFRWVRQRLKG
jgi:lysophospholipase